jgi:hypothetical protein
MATIKNLVLEQGATFSANIQYLNSNKVPIPLVGYNVRSKMRTSYNAANAAAFVAVITNAATGNITLSLTASETAALEYGRYVYDVEAYSGQVLVRVVEGTIDVTPGVSGMDLGSLLSGNVSTSDLIEGNNLYYTNARVQSALLNISGNILPSVSNTYNLGSPTQRWKSLFLEDKTIFLGNVAISLDDITNKLTFIDTANAAATISLQIGTGANSVTLDAQNGSLSTSLSPNSVTASMIAPGAISPDKIGGFNTANVPEFTNLYFTNTRAISAFTAGANIIIDQNGVISSTGGSGGGLGSITQANLTTSNVIELGSNLYYSNTRVYSNVITILSTYATVSNLNLKANLTQLTTANVAEVTNLYFTNTRVHANIAPLLTTANVAEVTNLYFTNTRVYANISPLLTTANVAEVTNLYFTNTRVYANIAPLLTTANVAESASNLYFTNTRVYANISPLLTTANVNEFGSNLYYTNARVYANVIGLLNLKANVVDLTTANVIESANSLYYTNARVRSAFSAGANITIDVNGVISSAGGGGGGSGTVTGANLTTSNVVELGSNLYYSNTRVYSNIIGLFTNYATVSNLNLKANAGDLTTANVSEVTNLYYTNARVRSAFSGGTGVSYDTTNGIISIGQNVSPNATVTFANLNVTGITNFYGNVTTFSSNNLSISDNMIYLNSSSTASNPDLGFAGNYNDGSYKHTGFFRDATDGVWKVFDSYTPEPDANIFIDTNHASFKLANLAATTFTGNVIGNVTGFVSSISNFTTSNLVEGNNLYYTNARVYANVISVLNAKANVGDLTTANVAESTNNLYYTNARVYSNVVGLFANYATIANLNLRANLTQLTTANITEVNNLYYTNTRVHANVIGLLNTKANVIDLTTSNVTESTSNLYYTNARVYANVISLLNLKANVIDLTTANVLELANNLYYTNARVYANVISLLNLKANVIDLTTSNVTESTSNLYYTNTRVYANVIGLFTNYATVANLDLNIAGVRANIAALLTSNISEVINLYYTNARVRANVIALLPTYSGNVGAANVTVGTGVGGAIVGANLISANNFVADTITANTFTLSYRPAFRVWGSTTANIIAGTTLDSGNVTLDYNQNSSYATATGIFTAPITGLYQIYFNSCIGSANGNSAVQILKNNVSTAGNVLCYWESDTNNEGGQNFGVSTVARLTASDNVRAKVLVGSIKFDANASWGVAFIG